MELRGLFQYLVNQLKRGQGIELVLLQVRFWFVILMYLFRLRVADCNFIMTVGTGPADGKCTIH